jgi:hypothetical protein
MIDEFLEATNITDQLDIFEASLYKINRIPVIMVLEVRVMVFFTNKNHALNTFKMSLS